MTSLADPLDLPSGVRLPNRIAKAALSEALGDGDNSPDERIVTLYRRWAQGGYGLLITGNIMVDRAHLGEPGNIAIEDDRALARADRVDQGRARRRSGDLRPAQPPRPPVEPAQHRAHAGRAERRAVGAARRRGAARAHRRRDRGHHRSVRDGGRGV